LSALFAEMRRKGVILDATVSVYAESDRKAGKKSTGMGPIAAQLTAAAYRAGVSISTGTDHAAAADSPYPSLQQEMELLVRQSGMSPADVIHSATEVGARALRAEGQMGTIAAGKLANLVVVSRNPLADITALRDVVLTIKRGRAYPRADYRQPPPEDLDGFW
jgi:imidazolonepropionase-like amidohydrolase